MVLTTKVCVYCLNRKPMWEFHSAGIKGKGYTRRVCKTCRREKRQLRRRTDPKWAANEKVKRNNRHACMSEKDFMLAIQYYGGVCKCGESRLEALLLHHTKVGKNKPELKHVSSWYTQLRRIGYPKGLIVLCGTCHLILHRKELRK